MKSKIDKIKKRTCYTYQQLIHEDSKKETKICRLH